GYPDGLKGREIPIGSRILAVIDAYLAMVSDRPHRPAMTQDAAFDELVRNAGSQFDPEVVEVFISMMEKKYPGKSRNRKMRILISDSNEEFRNLLKLRLVNDNFEVDAVSSVDDAMDKLMGRGADIVIADASPGSHDSLQLIREMREDETMRTIPFILLSDRDD